MGIFNAFLGKLALHIIFLLASPVFGLYKLVDPNTQLVPNAKPGWVYLFQFPRTQTTPSQAALNLKTECWLSLSGIKFHRLSNQFFLGSHTHGTAPFAFYQESAEKRGAYIDGSDAILENMVVGLRGDEAMELRKIIDDQLFTILMLDRATRDAQDKGGLDWMLADESIAEQMVPLLLDGATVLVGVDGKISMEAQTWARYFDAKNCKEGEAENEGQADECNQEEKTKFVSDFLKINSRDIRQDSPVNWPPVNDAIQEHVEKVLKTVFKTNGGGPGSSESKLDALLAERAIGPNNVELDEEAKFSSLIKAPNASEQQPFSNPKVFQLLKQSLDKIISKLKTTNFRQYLGGRRPSPTDCSLFGVLVQFFETPLNIVELREYFRPETEPLGADVQRLKNFVQEMKKTLHFHGEGIIDQLRERALQRNPNEVPHIFDWKKLTRRPWPLNYEPPPILKNRTSQYEGPFTLETDNLMAIFNVDGSMNWEELNKRPEVKAAAKAVEAEFKEEEKQLKEQRDVKQKSTGVQQPSSARRSAGGQRHHGLAPGMATPAVDLSTFLPPNRVRQSAATRQSSTSISSHAASEPVIEKGIVGSKMNRTSKGTSTSTSATAGRGFGRKKAFRVMAAYLCELGNNNGGHQQQQKSRFCSSEHLSHFKMSEYPDEMLKVQQLAYQAVVDYNDGLVKENVVKAWKQAEVAKSVSSNRDGNEL